MMIIRSLIFVAVAAGVAIQAPHYLARMADTPGQEAPVTPASAAASAGQQGFVIKADGMGHFRSRFRLNGKAIEALVDTGATFIAMNEEMARSLGIGGDSLRFRYEVETANGPTQAARVTLASVEIGSIRVRNVDAMVLRDNALSGVLVGMSFMRKLKSWNVEAGQMQLVN